MRGYEGNKGCQMSGLRGHEGAQAEGYERMCRGVRWDERMRRGM